MGHGVWGSTAKPPCPVPHAPCPKPLVMSTYVAHDHLLPIRPVVRVTVPDSQRVADATIPEDGRELDVLLVVRVAAADRDDYVLPPERGQSRRVLLVLHE